MAVSGVTAQLSRAMSEFSAEENDRIFDCIRKATLYCKRDLRASSPGHEYPLGWAARTTRGKGLITGRVFNQKKPGLTHLLEHQQPIRNQFGSYGSTGPGHGQIVHILPAQERAEEYLIELLTAEL